MSEPSKHDIVVRLDILESRSAIERLIFTYARAFAVSKAAVSLSSDSGY